MTTIKVGYLSLIATKDQLLIDPIIIKVGNEYFITFRIII